MQTFWRSKSNRAFMGQVGRRRPDAQFCQFRRPVFAGFDGQRGIHSRQELPLNFLGPCGFAGHLQLEWEFEALAGAAELADFLSVQD